MKLTIKQLAGLFEVDYNTMHRATSALDKAPRYTKNRRYEAEAVRAELIKIYDERIERHYHALTEAAAIRKRIRETVIGEVIADGGDD